MATSASQNKQQFNEHQAKQQQLLIEKYRGMFDYSVSKPKLPIAMEWSIKQNMNNKHKRIKYPIPMEWNYTQEMEDINHHPASIESPMKRRQSTINTSCSSFTSFTIFIGKTVDIRNKTETVFIGSLLVLLGENNHRSSSSHSHTSPRTQTNTVPISTSRSLIVSIRQFIIIVTNNSDMIRRTKNFRPQIK